MNTMPQENPLHQSFSDDALLRLEFAVAQRADDLGRSDRRGRGSELDFWLRAEREVIEHRSGFPQGGCDRHAGGTDGRE